jgi:micrococcal nuclease
VRRARSALAAVLVAVSLAACDSAPRQGRDGGGGGGAPGGDLVTRVVDGDTAHVEIAGRDVTVRFIGIDTPETVAPDQPVECYGPEASAYTEQRLEGERVRLEYDVERTDRYGRTLAYVWLGDELFNETLVREGYALVTTFPPDVKYVERFVAAQRDAREHFRGLWRECR